MNNDFWVDLTRCFTGYGVKHAFESGFHACLAHQDDVGLFDLVAFVVYVSGIYATVLLYQGLELVDVLRLGFHEEAIGELYGNLRKGTRHFLYYFHLWLFGYRGIWLGLCDYF